MSTPDYQSARALEDFRRQRSLANVQDIVAGLTGKPNDLLPYEEVRRKLKAHPSAKRELRDIPLDRIVGSVGRYTDFTRRFLPRNASAAPRWARVKTAVETMGGVPPIEVYQLGDVYFVIDGNHRASVARQLGNATIQAYVTPVKTRVTLAPDTSPDDLIVKAELADLLETIKLDETRPGADLTVTVPGQYAAIAADIEAHRQALSQQRGAEVSVEEAAADWYDTVYTPIVQIVRARGMLHDFPQRTEADLYVWISQHRADLERSLGWSIDADAAADDLATRSSTRLNRVAARIGGQLLGALVPDALERGPAPGDWRRDRITEQPGSRLSVDVLVPVNGRPDGWHALDQAIVVARNEGGRINGLHVVPTEAARESEAARAVRDEFERRCAEAGLPGRLALEVGGVAETICARARWNDLVVVNLAYPPSDQPVARLRSGFRALVQRCPRPILAVPRRATGLSRALLAYDGSPKAEEALFISTYLALQWGVPLIVVTVMEKGDAEPAALERARGYLEGHGAQATYVVEHGPVAPAILRTAEAHGCEMILSGGYGTAPLLEVVLGSSVDQVLRESKVPVLICR